MKTKTIKIAFALIIVASFLQAGAQSFSENEFAVKAAELEALAQSYFNSGEYDLATDTANQAFDNWVLSDDFVDQSLGKLADEDAIKRARAAAEAEAAQAEAEKLAEEQRKLEAADAERLANEQRLLDEEEAARLAEAERMRLEEDEAARLAAEAEAVRLAEEEAARLAEEEAARLASASERLAAEEAARLASEEAVMQALKLQAEEALNLAKDRVVWADSVYAKASYPKEWDLASKELNDGLASYDEGDFIRAKWHAEAVIEALANVQETLPLPALYTVRLIPERRDCFWNISGYSFIYNDPTKWQKIYEANKNKIQDPNNPDLIQPGQVFVIPSLRGETRLGEWDPNRTYRPLPRE